MINFTLLNWSAMTKKTLAGISFHVQTVLLKALMMIAPADLTSL